MKKEEIRRRIKNSKALVSDTDRVVASQRVFDRIEKLTQFILARNILIYNSLPDELSTREFLSKWVNDKCFFLPRVNGIDLDILPYNQTRTHIGAFHIEEPDGDNYADINEIDLIIVPAVAFDRYGNRVGRGKGYYDRLLRRMNAVTIGVGYDFQLVDSIDTEDHDIPLDIVITESHTINVKR